MTIKTILKQLSTYLKPIDIAQLHIVSAVPNSIILCMTISDIIKSYNSTQKNEDIVTDLLEDLCTIHFKKKRKTNALL